jgi:antitoxin CptB
MEQRLKKGYLQWRCRRGTKELDVVLTKFLDRQYEILSDSDLREFDELLNVQDTELWYWLSGQKTSDKISLQNMIKRISKRDAEN